MTRRRTATALGVLGYALAVACSNPYSGTSGDSPDAEADAPVESAPADAPSDSGGPCDLSKPFGGTQILALGPDGSTNDNAPRLSPDERTIVFASSLGGVDEIYSAQRASADLAFGGAALVTTLPSGGNNRDPMLAADGLALYFSTDRSDAGTDIWLATRPDSGGEFVTSSRVTDLDTPFADYQPFLTASGDELFFSSDRGGNPDIYRSVVSGAAFDAPARVFELATAAAEWDPVLSADGLTIYFSSNRAVSDSAGGFDIYVARRPTKDLPFGPATNVHELNTPSDDRPGWLSPDGCRLYLYAAYSGSFKIYRAERTR